MIYKAQRLTLLAKASSFLLLLFVSLYPLVACSKSMNTGLIEESNFQQLAQLMQQKNLPLLLEFHAEYCAYCRELEEDFLAPMSKDKEFDDKIIIRQLALDSDEMIVDFQGKKVSVATFAGRYKAYMTPTMIFIDSNGKELAEKIIGINTPSLFGAYIDIAIEKALNKVRAKGLPRK